MRRLITRGLGLVAAIAFAALSSTKANAQVTVAGSIGADGSYTTLTAAFTAINANVQAGNPIAIVLTGNTTEPGAAVLNAGAWSVLGIGCSVPVTVSGTSANGLIVLNGADNVTIDGRISSTGRNITIQNTSTAAGTAGVWLSSTGVGAGATNNVIRNCNILCGVDPNSSSNASFGIISSGATITATLTSGGNDNDNNQYLENSIEKCRYGIFVNGVNGNRDVNTMIADNIVGPSTFGANNIGKTGILLSFQDGATVTRNTVQNVGVSAAMTGGGTDRFGIALGNEAWGTTPGVPAATSISNVTVSRNLIHDVVEEKTFSCVGIYLSAGTTTASNNTICSNMLYNVRGNGTFGDACVGIGVGSGNGDMIVHNSVAMTGDFDPGAATSMSQTVCGIRLGGSGASITNIGIYNNIFYMDVTSNSNILCVAAVVPSTTYAFGTGGMNNNDYYFPAANTFMRTAGTGTGSIPTAYYATLPNFQAALTPAQNAASIQANPDFISASDLHIQTSSVNVDGLASVVACNVDFDGTTRGGTPDIGADEYSPVPCAGANGGTITPSTATVCAGTTTVMSSSGATVGMGTSYQWMVSTVSGGPYSNVTGGSGATTTTYTTGALTAGTYYYVLQVTCSVGPVTGLSNELTVTVNPQPTVNVSPASANYCSPGSPVALTASGTSINYAWGPAAGLSAVTGANVNASPAVNTTYTVTGVDGNGCTATATSTITVVETPSMALPTATPPSVCSGGSSQLLTAGATTTSYAVTPITFAPVPVPGVGVTTLASAGTATTALSAGTLDDGGWYNQNIGFSFNFYGVSYTQFSVSTNGFIVLGGGTPNTNTGYGTAFPSVTPGRPSVGAVYSDLDFRTMGTVNYYVTGTAPNRALVVNWSGGQFFSGTGAITTQAIIYETSNIIEVHTNNSTGTNAGVQGIQNAAGTAAVTVAGRNANNFVVSAPDAYRWAPTGGTVTYSWAPPTFLSSTTVANPMANSVTATVTYTATVTNSGCSASGTVTVTAGAALTSSGSISPASTVCEGVTVTLNSTPVGGGAPYTYAWTGPNTFSSTLQNPTVVASLAAAGTYTLVITDNCAATSTVTLTLGVNAAPTLTVSPVSATYCSGSAGLSLTATGTSTSYTWGPAAGLSATTGSSVTATPSVTTTYTVTGTDGNGCTSTATSAITYGMTPVVTASSTPAAICEGGNATLNGVGSFAPTYCQPVYSTGTGFGDYISSVVLNTLNNPTGASASPYYTLYPASGNTTTTLVAGTTYTITLSPGTYTINDMSAWIDFNQNGTLNDASEKLGETDNMGAAPATTSFTFTVPLTALNGPTRLRVREMDHGGTNDMDPCAAQSQWGETEDYVVTITGGVDAVSYAWSPSTYLSSTTGASVNAVAAMSTTTYTVTGTSSAGCTSTGSATLTVNALPTVTATLTPSTVCAGDMVTPAGGGATSYTWTGGLTDAVAFAAVSSDTYTVTGTDANGCTNTATASLTVNPLPVVTLSGNTTICAGDTTILTGSSGGTSQWYLNGSPIAGATANTYAATTAGVYNMIKTNVNGCADSSATGITVVVNALPSVTANSTSAAVCAGDQVTLTGGGATSYIWTGGVTDNVAFTPVATDTYTVTGTDANGCSNTATTTVTVNALPAVTASLTPSTACVGDMVTPAGSGASTYVWTGGLTDGVAFAATVSDTYTVTGTDANGCSATTTVSITVNALPVVTASATDSSVCVGDQITFMGGGASTYTWDNGVTDMVPYAVMASGTFIVTGTDANGCMDTASLYINANALPNVTLSLPLDTACLLLGPVTLGGESPVGGTWSGPGVSGNSFDPGVAGNGMHAITYTYTDSVTGCSASVVDSMLVDICNSIDNNSVGNAVVYPNPNNGDFTLIPAGSGMVDVMIYSATGQLVVAEKAIAGQPNQIKLEASGMYSVVIITADGVRTTQRVVVNR